MIAESQARSESIFKTMYRIARGTTHNLSDVGSFIDMLNDLENNPAAAARGLFSPEREVFVTRAPGRLDVMGGIADYSGSLMLELPLGSMNLSR